jgi:hypothetical protein
VARIEAEVDDDGSAVTGELAAGDIDDTVADALESNCRHIEFPLLSSE